MCSVTIMRPYKLKLKQRGGSLEDEVQVTLFEYTLSKNCQKLKKSSAFMIRVLIGLFV